jgi:hypothetical protein
MLSPTTTAKIMSVAQKQTVAQQEKYFSVNKFHPHKLLTMKQSKETKNFWKNNRQVMYSAFVHDLIDARLEERKKDHPSKNECERYALYHYNFWRCVYQVSWFHILFN